MTKTAPRIIGLDHVQLAMPAGEEATARAFYGNVLGLTEDEKPAVLARRGGAWFSAGTVRLHLGVEADFRPARKAHPAIAVSGLDDLAARLEGFGSAITWDGNIEGTRRFHAFDPFGNRIEFVEVRESCAT